MESHTVCISREEPLYLVTVQVSALVLLALLGGTLHLQYLTQETGNSHSGGPGATRLWRVR